MLGLVVVVDCPGRERGVEAPTDRTDSDDFGGVIRGGRGDLLVVKIGF